jgi:Glycogen recognition site of AMP-activated protein kinase
MAEYRDDISDETAALAKRVADHLRTPERLAPSFDDRLMQSVRAEAADLYPRGSGSSRSWRGARLQFSPLGALALAAGIAAVAVLSTLEISSRMTTSARTAPAQSIANAVPSTDTVNLVRFVFVDANARSVEIVGDFNEWTKGANKLQLSGAPGVWSVSVPLSPGRHEYAFIINGSRWVADPLAMRSSDDFGTESSVIRVGSPTRSTT